VTSCANAILAVFCSRALLSLDFPDIALGPSSRLQDSAQLSCGLVLPDGIELFELAGERVRPAPHVFENPHELRDSSRVAVIFITAIQNLPKYAVTYVRFSRPSSRRGKRRGDCKGYAENGSGL